MAVDHSCKLYPVCPDILRPPASIFEQCLYRLAIPPVSIILALRRGQRKGLGHCVQALSPPQDLRTHIERFALSLALFLA
jgi:hypothetical protein